MATRIELPKDLVKRSFTTTIASLKRAINNAGNPGVKTALEHELAEITKAVDTASEIK